MSELSDPDTPDADVSDETPHAGEHDVEPTADVKPVGHGMHTMGLAAYVLAGQLLHEAALKVEDVEPAGHAKHTPQPLT